MRGEIRTYPCRPPQPIHKMTFQGPPFCHVRIYGALIVPIHHPTADFYHFCENTSGRPPECLTAVPSQKKKTCKGENVNLCPLHPLIAQKCAQIHPHHHRHVPGFCECFVLNEGQRSCFTPIFIVLVLLLFESGKRLSGDLSPPSFLHDKEGVFAGVDDFMLLQSGWTQTW